MASAQIKLRNGGKEEFGSMRSDHGSCFKFIFVSDRKAFHALEYCARFWKSLMLEVLDITSAEETTVPVALQTSQISISLHCKQPASSQFYKLHALWQRESKLCLGVCHPAFSSSKGWKTCWWRAKNKAVTRAVWSIRLRCLPVRPLLLFTSPLWCLTCEEEANQAAHSVIAEGVCV